MTAGRPARRGRSGAIVGAAWLIGLGSVFLIRDQAGWSWAEAWPLFIILVGVASFVSLLVGFRGVGAWSLLWPIGWLVVGIALLLSTTGAITNGPLELIAEWWPVALMVIGAWFLVAAVWPRGGPPTESLDLPLAPGPVAAVRIRFGAGELLVGRGAPGRLVVGSFKGGVVVRDAGANAVELQPDTRRGWPVFDQRLDWRVGLTNDVPLDLRVDSGASRAVLDLTELGVRRLDLTSGASETRVLLPRAAGFTELRAETGAASLTISVPVGVAAYVRSRMALGRVYVNEARFPRAFDGYASPDYQNAPNRVEIDVQAGVGSVTIS